MALEIHTERLYNGKWFACVKGDENRCGTVGADGHPRLFAIAETEERARRLLSKRYIARQRRK